jgi:hypothetical protein
MRSHCDGPEVYVPFRDGIIICDESQWGVWPAASVTAVKYPQRYRWFIEGVLPHVFLGEVRDAHVNEHNDEEIVLVCSKPIPHEFYYCRVKIVRHNCEICQEQIVGSMGGPSGPWLMNRPGGAIIQSGDELWATGRIQRELISEGVPR